MLQAMGLDHKQIEGAIRFSFSEFNTSEEMDEVIDKTKAAVNRFRKLGSFQIVKSGKECSLEKNLYIVRCGEVALKGMNKPYFERILLERVRKAIECFDDAEAKWIDGLMFVRVPDTVPEDDVIAKCVRVFGVASVSPAVEAPKDIDEIGSVAAEFMQKIIDEEGIKTFKVKGKRADKSFAVQSPEIGRIVGAIILKTRARF